MAKCPKEMNKQLGKRLGSHFFLLCRSLLCGHHGALSSIIFGQSFCRFSTSLLHKSHHDESLGKNLPFSIENKWRLLATVTVYFGSGFAAPFHILRHQMLKKYDFPIQESDLKNKNHL
ncbi:cytochrome c oxidase subunit 7C, mitochondrial-like [Dromiciops gliroides]|uniref:cytochrome c oxidase subunit 7C, mitochondrial-like n=1 Tax=Dromiciops gliroides TaxID=33562 RepID=UPI001CC66287|nr:cytochrome c oxidase subunit 7C, mitochondrial-like [Dromiciops gliroides]